LTGASLVALLHLCDSLFPIGGFACSDGLESATASGAIATAADLRAWMTVCLDESLAGAEGPTVCLAWSAFHAQDWEAMARLDQEITALRPSSTSRRASRAMGLRLLTTWRALYPAAPVARLIELAHAGVVGPAWPVAFACVCAASSIERRVAVEAFAYHRLAASVSSAMRLMPIGQASAHALLAEALGRVPAMAEAVLVRSGPAASFPRASFPIAAFPPASFTPAMDLAAMSQQYLHSRLFRS
jgi:urease accessory protein